jgi:precorrin-2/cobalt-factor-2 C20-methyltransferase
MTGKLYGVGVGPGDPELMTLKAVRIIRECDVIAVPDTGDNEMTALSIAQKALPEISCKKIISLALPMSRDPKLLAASHTRAANQVTRLLLDGCNVAFLTLGDPTVYSTYMYVHKIVLEMDGQAEIVPGVPSFCAAAARLGISLAEGGEALHILPGSYQGISEGLDLAGTKVLMKTGKSFEKLKLELESKGMLKRAKMVQRCGMKGERVFDDLAQAEAEASYFSIIIVKDAKE